MTLVEKNNFMISQGKTATLYFDMDGVLAKWEVGCTYEKTWEPGYFAGLELEEAVRDAILLLRAAGFKCRILSAVYTEGSAAQDKACWLEKVGLGDVDRLFVPCGVSKSEFVNPNENETSMLLDDYNFNLVNWKKEGTKSPFIAVKFLNGINGGSSVWTGRTVYHRSSAEAIANALADAVVLS